MKEPCSKENNSRIFHKLSNEADQLAEQSCEEMIQNLKRNVAERGERSIL
jgi:hypothetical protein